MRKMKSKIVNCAPTWSGLMPAFFTILRNGSPKQREAVKAELMEMARIIDENNRRAQANRKKGK